MEWFNIHVSTLDSEEFKCAAPVEQATWLKLQRFCIGQENGGRLKEVKSWQDRTWIVAVGVKRAEVQRQSRLWKWEGNDVVVRFYPIEKEREIRAKRQAGRDTVRKRWSIDDGMSISCGLPGAERVAELSAELQAEQVGERVVEPKAERNGELIRKGREGKGMERKGTHTGTREGISDGPEDWGAAASPPGEGLTRMEVRYPTEAECIAWGAVEGIEERRAREFWLFYEGQARVGPNGEKVWVTSGGVVVTNWKAKLKSWKGREQVAPAGRFNSAESLSGSDLNKKPAGAAGGSDLEPGWAKRRRLKEEISAMEEEWKFHPANKTGFGEKPVSEPTAEQREDFAGLERRLEVAVKELRKLR